jgi:hypothetical protein
LNTEAANVGVHACGVVMTASKSARLIKQNANIFAPRAIGEGDPEVYTREELKLLIEYGLQYGRGLRKGRNAANFVEQVEAFRRRCLIIWIFRGLPENFRKRPSGHATKNAVLDRLEKNGISITERTLMRDFKALGGAKFLRGARPFARGEDQSFPMSQTRPRRSGPNE